MEDEAGHHLPHHQPLSKPKTKRSYLKCEQCRHDRKLCEFFDDNPACKRCDDLNHDCSGPKKAEKKAGKKRKADEATEDTDQPAGGNDITQTTASEATQNGGMSKRSSTHVRGLDGVDVNVMAQALHKWTRRDLKISMAFEKDHETSQVILNHIDRELALLSDCLVPVYDDHQSQSRLVESQQPEEEIPALIDSEFGGPVTLLCTETIRKPRGPGGTQLQGRVHNTFKELPKEYYLYCEKTLKKLMASLPRDNSAEWTLHCQLHDSGSENHGPYPAFVIAWLNLDFEVAYALWQDTATEGLVVDILGRSFIHLVTESGDPRPLGKMGSFFLKFAGLDGRELSLLDLAVIGNAPSIVMKVIEENLVLGTFTVAMQRAILGNRKEIARAHLLPHLIWSDKEDLVALANLAYEKGWDDLGDQIKQVKPYQTTKEDAVASLDNVNLETIVDEYGTVWNSSSGFPYMTQYFPPTQNYAATWNNFNAGANTLFRSPRNDPGGGGHNHMYDPPYSAS